MLNLAQSSRGSSPHTRGARTWQPRSRRRSGDHPRIRGEHKTLTERLGGFAGSSPHTRGAPILVYIPSATPRIIPAYAGSTNNLENLQKTKEDHPRIRGEHFIVYDPDTFAEGSSPHTRGAPQMFEDPDLPPGIIPAYAGSTF